MNIDREASAMLPISNLSDLLMETKCDFDVDKENKRIFCGIGFQMFLNNNLTSFLKCIFRKNKKNKN